VPDKVTDEELKLGLRKLGEKYLRLTDLILQPQYGDVKMAMAIDAH